MPNPTQRPYPSSVAYRTSVILDARLAKAVKAHGDRLGIKMGPAIRDLLRAALGEVDSEQTAAWKEAYAASIQVIKRRLRELEGDLDDLL